MIMVTDTSGSMLAKDVRPDRLTAAREAARTLARQVPEDFRIGLIKFGSQAEQVVEPTTDRARLMLALRQLSVQGATAMGDGLKLGLEAAQTPIPDGLGGTRKLPTAIVLLSDGASTRGEDPIDIAQQAKKAKIRIYTVALGTPSGTLETTRPDGSTRTEKVPPDTLTLQDIARDTGGRYFNAPDADQLEAVYSGLATRFATRAREAGDDLGVRRRRARAAARRPGVLAAARGAAAVSPRLRLVPPPPDRSPERPGPGPRPAAGAALARPRGHAPRREPDPGRAPDAAGRRRHRPDDDPALPARRRRPPHRLERDRADARAARARARRRARADVLAAAGRVGLDDLRHRRPPQGRRRGGRRAGGRARRDAARQPARRARLRRAASRACSSRARAGSACWGCSASCGASPAATAPGGTSIGGAVTQAAALARNRGLVVVVSDFRGAADWEGPLRSLRGRHGVMAVEIRDPREQELTPMGDVWVMDPETGRQVAVNTSRRKVRERFAAAAAAEREQVAARAARAPGPTTSCSPPRATGCASSPTTCAAARRRCAPARRRAPPSSRAAERGAAAAGDPEPAA